MAEDSMLWNTTGTGDGPSGGYTQQNWLDYHRYIFNPDLEATAGVLPRKGNKLACTPGAASVNVDTGAAFVYGFFYKNTAALNLAVATPSLGTTGLRVVLRANWAAQTVRATVVRSNDGVSAAPALTQTAGTTWDITLATGSITTGGVVTLADGRSYLQPAFEITAAMLNAGFVDNTTLEIAAGVVRAKDGGISNAKLRDSAARSVLGRSVNSIGVPADIVAGAGSGAVLRESANTIGFGQVGTLGIADDAIDDTKAGSRVPQFYRRQGGNVSDWSIAGPNTYIPTAVRMQAGVINCVMNSSGGPAVGTVTITFPAAFSQKPIIVATSMTSEVIVTVEPIVTSASQVKLSLKDTNGMVNGTVGIMWIAIGPE